MNLMNTIGSAVLNQVLSSVTSGPNGPIVKSIITLVTQNGGAQGVTALIQQFEKNGLGQIVQSWVGTGANQPVTAEQVAQGLGDAHVQQIAQQAGVTPQEATTQLAQVLPTVIDKITPSGGIDPALINQILAAFTQQKAA